MFRRYRWFLMAAFLLYFCACTRRLHTPSVVPEFGRARLIGVSSRAKPVSLTINSDSSMVVLGWPTRMESGQDQIHLYIQDMEGPVRYDSDLLPSIAGLDQIKIIDSASEGMSIFWTAGTSSARVLWGAALPAVPDLYNNFEVEPTQISPSNVSVVWFESLLVDSGDYALFWLNADGSAHAQLGMESTPYRILENVEALAANTDKTGTPYLVWAFIMPENKVVIVSASLNTSQMQLDSMHELSSIRLPQRGERDYIKDLTLSVMGQQHTIGWTQPYDYGGRSARQLVTKTYQYDLEDGAYSNAAEVYPLSRDFPPDMVLDSRLNLHVVKADDSMVTATNVRGVSSSTVISDVETVLAASVEYATRTRTEYQPTFVYLNRQGYIGHHPLTWTNHPSLYPVVTCDRLGNLYGAWIDNIGIGFQYPVYLTTTRAEINDISKHLLLVDYAVVGWDWLNRIAMGIVLIPLVVQWFLLPIAFLTVVLIRGDTFGQQRKNTLLVGLFLFWVGKYLLTSQILTLVPVSLTVSHVNNMLLSRLVPVLTLLTAVLAEAIYCRLKKRVSDGLLSRFLRISMLDTAISMAIYAIGSFG